MHWPCPVTNNNNKEDITMKHLFALSALVLLLGVNPAFADQASDREEIEALLWRYARALDTLDADAYVAVFTEDGSFESGSNSSKGHAALRTMIDGVKKNQTERAASSGQPSPPMFHMTTDSWIEFVDADHARHHSYWLTVFGAAGAGSLPNVAAAGRGIDELVRVNGKWLIQSRNVAPQD
jgi:3-phenylpropionate/cinnamic acid dioxygenase small subunit